MIEPDPHYCPVEGCDYGTDEETSLAAVRSHINASSKDGHHWDQLKPLVEQQDQQEPDDDQPEDQQPDQQEGGDGEGSETSTDQGNDQQDDVARQWGNSTADDDGGDDQGKGGDGEGGDGGPDTSDDGGTNTPFGGGIPLPVSAHVLVAGLAALLLVVLVLQYRRTGGDDVEIDVEEPDPADDADDTPGTGDTAGLVPGGEFDV